MAESDFTESVVEQAALAWFEVLGYDIALGPDVAPGEPKALRTAYDQTILHSTLRTALENINPHLSATILDDVFAKVVYSRSPNMLEENQLFHRYLVDGIDVEFIRPDGSIGGDKAWLLDFDDMSKNKWLAINQFTIIEGAQNRRPDIVVFVNGLPLAILELKNAADEHATISHAFRQLQTYKTKIPTLFRTNVFLVISDGLEAHLGTLTSDKSRFLPWRTIDGETIAPKGLPQLEVLLKGVFAKENFLDLIRNFVVFQTDGANVSKKLAAYHQFHAVNKAIKSTVIASSQHGDKRAGVVWHTQGSGKSLSMVFYAGKLIQHAAMNNPTIVVLTDRNDLDDQLFGTFASAQSLLRQSPIQAESRAHLREILHRGSGGVIFTTIQKFAPETGENYPLLSDRRNVLVVADEAHRSQYDFVDGFARHMRDGLPNATFIGFTGTPIEHSDKNTPAVFGNYVDIYDIQRAVEDGSTVRIYYESRLAKIDIDQSKRPHLDTDFEEVTEHEEVDKQEKLKSKWARLEALVGAEERIKKIAADLVVHYERRIEAMTGKAMIVGMSRRICVEIYNEIVKLRPEWDSTDDASGAIKVIMTGSASDPAAFQPHIRNKTGRDLIAKRLKDPADSLQIVIVRDMWLTGFDAPILHTMYVDKPMKGHGLMQAIARVNRVFKDKPGGLIVDYLGIADQLKRALHEYTEGDRRQAGIPIDQAIAVLLEKFEIAVSLMHGFDFALCVRGTPAERLSLIPAAMEHILSLPDGKKRFMQAVLDLSKAFALTASTDEAKAIRDEVGFLQTVRAAFSKTTGSGKSGEELDTALQQLISKAVSSTEVVDIFAAAGLKTPDISILSDEFLDEVQGMERKNLALELLKKLLKDEIKTKERKNIVQSKKFSEMLEGSLLRYQNRLIETAQVIDELIQIAKHFKAENQRGIDLGLTDDEVAFYDALEVNDSAVQVLGDKQLKVIAQELVDTVRRNTSIDWQVKESVRAKLRVLVKRILRKYGYPPDLQESATLTVLRQAELISDNWAFDVSA